MAYQLKVTGAAELVKTFGRLSDPKRQRAALRSSFGAGAVVIRKAMRQEMRSHERTGSTYDALDFKVKVYASGVVFATVGVRRGSRGTYYSEKVKGRIVPANYWHLLNEGTQPHPLTRGFRLRQFFARGGTSFSPRARLHPGAKPANIIGRSLAQSRTKANAAIAKRYQKRLLAEAKKRG